MDIGVYYEKEEDYDSPSYYAREKNEVVNDDEDDDVNNNNENDVIEEDSIHHANVLFHNDNFYDGEEQTDNGIIWEVVLDPNTKEKYFYNTITGLLLISIYLILNVYILKIVYIYIYITTIGEAQWEIPPGLTANGSPIKTNTRDINNEAAISEFMESEEDK
jgi:hypothetical protein